MKNLQIHIAALILTITALSLVYYKVTELGLPLSPGQKTDVWTMEARISFMARNQPVKLELNIPRQPPGFVTLNEDYMSSNYGLATDFDNLNRRAQWAVRSAEGEQVLYYRLEAAFDPHRYPIITEPVPEAPSPPALPEAKMAALHSIIDDVRMHSADAQTFTSLLIKRIRAADSDSNIALLINESASEEQRVREIIALLAAAEIPARQVSVLALQDGIRNGMLTPWLEIYTNRQWLAFNPVTGEQGYTPKTLLWSIGNNPIAMVSGGSAPEVAFSIARHSRAQVSLAEQWARQVDSHVMQFSLFSLPVHTQNVYRIILLVPLGALAIVVLRNLIGVRTFGTFMPILIALAFRETELFWGIILFILMVATGLVLRLYLERLKLLLVPRLTAVLTIVILLMAMYSILSAQLGLDRGLSIALFPVVILAMTIERMSVVWEENGAREAVSRGLGSLLGAVLGYFLMSSTLLAHLLFTFPELLLVVIAATLLLGRYTGYRLTELWRFRAIIRSTR